MAETKQTKPVEGELIEQAEAATDAEVVQEATTLARQPIQGESILSIIKDAVVNKADVAVMRELLAIRREERADMAREAFANALVQFRALVKTIIMTGHRDDSKTRKRDGSFGSVKYDYAELTTTVEQITPALNQCGLTPTWRMVKNDPTWVEVECIVTHTLAHRESSMPLGSPPEGSSGQTSVQKRMGTITSLQRKSLFMVLGLVTKEEDRHLNDAEQGDDPEPPKPQSQELVEQNPAALTVKQQFVAACRTKAGDPNMPMPLVKNVYEAAAKACGSPEYDKCLEYIQREDVIVGTGGTLAVMTDAEPPQADPFEQTAPTPQYECDMCHQSYMVVPAGGRCTRKVGRGICAVALSRIMA